MDITLLGTGCPAVHTERYGAGQLIRHGDTEILIDCGSGVTQRLVGAGSSGAKLEAVLLTHLHSDHLIDIYQLIVSAWHQGRTKPQRIYGPTGTRKFVEGMMAVWREELNLRIKHERRPSTAALDLDITEIEAGQTLEFGEITVAVVAVDHQPIDPAFGFIFSATGTKIALSGDTTYCPALIEAAKDVDLLVHEVFVHREMHVVDGLRSAETIEAVAGYHTLSHEVGKVASAAGVGCLLLTHIVPPNSNRDELLAEVKQSFSGPVLVGEDLMRVDPVNKTVAYGVARVSYA
ncbi:MBL fold metallo-hydrolase [Kiloniella laminariae]|uniref:MBL fold metallo-hydrolase n=1 Tax=Kiloniella laminariae TaxID=454162 RepID=A0ABT4LDS7_9PROT|nr:MBL fold metallo-hydrolase [Kiloniella laminariae]MCZ4279244.1 MBL fold metallo-hydrolase [Kiloniella laminariae]